MASSTICRRAGIPAGVTTGAIDREVCTCEWEVCQVVIDGGRRPRRLSMTDDTVRGIPFKLMIGICSCVVVVKMTPDAGVGCVIVIAVVTKDAIICNWDVSTLQEIVIIMDREGSGVPVRISGMTGCTVSGQT